LRRPKTSRRRLFLLAAGVFVLSVALALPPLAQAEITLIRVYQSEGEVFEVCRGKFNPPVTDHDNPAYCHGTAERWTRKQWQAYNATGKVPGPAGGKKQTGGESGGKAKAGGQPKVAVGAKEPSPAAAVIPYGGSLDPTTVLGVENPLCGQTGELSAAQVQNCRASRSPEAAYPVGNYGWDIHIEEGGFIFSTLVPITSFVLQIFSVIWLVLLLFLKGCLIVLGFTFSLSPFTNNHMLHQIGEGLSRFYANLTSPWLSTLFVVLGGWALYNGLIRRKAGETIGGMLAALTMMLGALWVIYAPGQTVGTLADVVNKTSLMAVSAPSSGHLSAPVRSYNDAMAKVWNQLTAVPFCAMDFSDVQWCLKAKPSQDALDAAKGGLSLSEPYTQQMLSTLPKNEQAAERALEERMKVLFGPAPTIRDLYLRFSPSSGPRDALWDYYNGKPDEHVGLPLNIGPQLNIGGGTDGVAPEKVSMQGRSGLVTRMVLVLIFAVGLLGGLLLLLWLAMKLVMAAAASFVLVLAAPVAMFFPAFGQAGRSAFTRWATSLLGAVVAKFTFSALLGIVLLGSSVLGAGVGGSSPTLGLIATMAFWWAVFLNREKFLALLQIDAGKDRDFGVYRALAGGYLGYRVAKAAKGAISRKRGERADRKRHEEEIRSQTHDRAADDELTEQAGQRLDVATDQAAKRNDRYSDLGAAVSRLRDHPEVQALRRDPSSLSDSQRRRAEAMAVQLQDLEGEQRALRPQAQADRQLLGRVAANETAGLPRYSRSDVQGAKDEIRRQSALPDDAPDHRWRAEAIGLDPDSPVGRQAIVESLATSRAAGGAMPPQRLDQVDLHRSRRIKRGRRRATSGGAQPPPGSASRQAAEQTPGDRPRPARRAGRVRDWLSR
jgi:hypothetical protein